MDDLLNEFLTETSESLESLDVELVKLEQNPNDLELLSNIFRLVHTIKGTCGFLGLPRLEAVAHAGENVLGNFRDGSQEVTPEAVSLILESLDCIKSLLSALEATEAEPEGDDSALISRLDMMYRAGKAGGDGAGAVAPPAPTAGPATAKESGTLYERLGGASPVDAAVEILYRKILADPDLARFFEGVDMIRLQGRQVEFMVKALGGPDEYVGGDIRAVHKRLVDQGMTGDHFDKVAGYLVASLQELEVGQSLIDEIIAVVATTRDDVLNLSDGAEAPQAEAPGEAVPEAPVEALKSPSVSGSSPIVETAEDTQSKESAVANQSIRVNVDLLENLMTMVSELVLTRNQLMQMVRKHDDSEFLVPLQRLSHVTTDLQEGVMKTRMQPIGNAWGKLPRIVRDIGLELGKKINLQMIGAETELDRQVLELIKDPLTHMVRNSGDHGLETTEDRIAAGKPEIGNVVLRAFHEGGHIIIEISDDGRGINIANVKRKILSSGLATEADLEAMSEKQIQRFIFKAGFSTAEKVTNVSGRGVGMDVVRTNIERIGGSIEMLSVEGKGSTFTIKIPLTLAIVSALIVECCGERFAIPQLSVVELVRISSATENRIETIKDTKVLRLRNRLLPLVSLAELLKLKDPNKDSVFGEAAEPAASGEQGAEARPADDAPASSITANIVSKENTDEIFIVVAQVGTHTLGVIVDRVFDTEEIVVKPVAPILRHISFYSGNTILGDGRVIMILDPNGIAAAAGDISISDRHEATETNSNATKSDKVELLIFRAGGTEPKAVPLALIARLEEIDVSAIEFSNGVPLVQYRGHLMPLLSFDETLNIPETGRQPVLVFTDRDRNMGLMVDEIIDIVEDNVDVELRSATDGVIGGAVVAGKATDIIDASEFLTRAFGDWFGTREQKSHLEAETANRVLLIDDSPFFRNLLTPLLTAAGYQVTTADSADNALTLRDAGEVFDIIVSDIEMPGMNGFEFAENVRLEGAWMETPIVALSSHTSDVDLDKGRAAGFDDYVAKLDRDALLESLSQSLTSLKGVA